MALKPITDTLRHVRGGLLINETSELLAEIVKAVEVTGKAGKLTIELQIKKLSRSGALEIIDKVTSKIPSEAALTTMMYPTPEGNLITEDPRQQKLDLKTVRVVGASDVTPIKPASGEE
ncbi:hypothetical protein ACMHYO_16370 [Allopusillimonas ginsengisoli]|uniref:hypothetical protein n=1 Tax=Allopusillimonas ginsengisoli TaxID=453575 RepID=UPI0039C174EE